MTSEPNTPALALSPQEEAEEIGSQLRSALTGKDQEQANILLSQVLGAAGVQIQAAAIEQRQEYYQGPIPPPDLAEAYEKLVPGAADRLLTLTENQAAHRQNIEMRSILWARFNETFGLLSGGGLMLLMAAGGLYATLHGHQPFGLACMAPPVAGAIKKLIEGQKKS